MKRRTNRRPQNPKPRLPRPRSVTFQDEHYLADKEAAKEENWLTDDVLDEIEHWEDYV